MHGCPFQGLGISLHLVVRMNGWVGELSTELDQVELCFLV